MNNDELKKKIAQIIADYFCPQRNEHKNLWGDDRLCYSKMNFAECERVTECTDALIAAGIGDTEWQHDVFKKTYMDFIAKLHYDKKFFKRFDDVSLGCKLVMFEDILDQNKKEFV